MFFSGFLLQIIPPDEWNPLQLDFDFENDESSKFPVNFYEILKASGDEALIYNCRSKKLATKNMTLRQFYKASKLREKRFSDLDIDQREKLILDGAIKQPIYATDVNFSVLNRDAETLNLYNFPNLLDNYVKQYGHAEGVTSPLSYVGAIGSRFAWHVEDMHLLSISILLFGYPKIWYTIPADQGHILERIQSENKQWPSMQCENPLRHKTNCFDPYYLISRGINVYKVNFLTFSKILCKIQINFKCNPKRSQ